MTFRHEIHAKRDTRSYSLSHNTCDFHHEIRVLSGTRLQRAFPRDFHHEICAQSEIRLHRAYNPAMKISMARIQQLTDTPDGYIIYSKDTPGG